jgi:chromosome partitioning protein
LAILTMLNQKGGVGKTSTCHHLSGTLALLGRRVLLVDNDPQASLTQGFWGPQATRRLVPSETIAAVYAGEGPFPAAVVRPTGIPGVDLVPGSKHATRFNYPEPHLAAPAVQGCLREFLADVRDDYDLILIDCPPNLHLCSWASLVASDCLVVPLKPEDYGAQGIIDVNESVALVRSGPNPAVRLLGYLLTMVSPRKTIHQLYEAQLRETYGPLVFGTRVCEAVEYVEALNQSKPVVQYKPKGAAAKVMKALAEEIEGRLADGSPSRTEAA